jgi:choline kinase
VSVTKGIILAAGVGSRLRPLTDDRPKCLLEVGGRSLVDHQLSALARFGVTDIVIVVGYREQMIRTRLDKQVRYVTNERFAHTNSLYSLWLARDELMSGSLILNSDVFALPALFGRLLQSPAANAILVEPGDGFEPEDMKVKLSGDLAVDFGKDLPAAEAHAHNVGVAKFERKGAAELARCLDRLVASGHENDWTPAAFREFASRWPLAAVPTDGLPWIEIDYVEDLKRAVIEIAPAVAALDGPVSA